MKKMKKKKRSGGSKKGVGGITNPASVEPYKGKKEEKVLNSLVLTNPASEEAYKSEKEEEVLNSLAVTFGSISMEEVVASYKKAKADTDKPGEITGNSLADNSAAEDQSTTCSISSGNLASSLSSGLGSSSSTASSSEVFVDADFLQKGVRNQKGRSRKVVATAGTVSTMLGKDYVRSLPKRISTKSKRFNGGSWSKEDMEQFLHSTLEDCDLDMGVVRDVLCQCGYDVDRALTVLLELSSSSEQSQTGHNNTYNKEDTRSFLEASESLTDRTSDSASHSSEGDFPDSVWYSGHISRTGEAHAQGSLELELPQKVLESLFNMPTPKSAEQEPNTMNWKNIVKKMTSLGPRLENCGGDGAAVKSSPGIAKGDEYQVFRESAKQHWDSMKFCYQKAATAFSNGGRSYAAYMSKQGRLHYKRAQEADKKASQDIFEARNKTVENMITIDLHGQHVKQAIKLLKLHLIFGAFVRSVRTFRVITGCGSHGVGKSELKQSVINLLEKEGIKWCEENRGTLLIRLDEQTEFSFLETDSDND